MPGERSADAPGAETARRSRSALIFAKKHVSMYRHSAELGRLLGSARGGGAAGVAFLLLHVDAAQTALTATEVLSSGEDQRNLERVKKWTGVAASCGSTLLFTLTSPFSAGLTATLAVVQGASCIGNVADLFWFEQHGKTLFDTPAAKAVQLGLETASLFGSIAGLGMKTAVRGGLRLSTSGAVRALLRRGPVKASVSGLTSVGLEAGAVGLRGVDVLWEIGASSEPQQLPATDANVRSALRAAGLDDMCPVPPDAAPALSGNPFWGFPEILSPTGGFQSIFKNGE